MDKPITVSQLRENMRNEIKRLRKLHATTIHPDVAEKMKVLPLKIEPNAIFSGSEFTRIVCEIIDDFVKEE